MTALENCSVVHHFATGIYAKEQVLLAGYEVTTHRHTYDHLSILAKGKCRVTTDQGCVEYTAPACVTIEKGLNHRIEAIEDATWFCIHNTFETDPEKVDHVLIART